MRSLVAVPLLILATVAAAEERPPVLCPGLAPAGAGRHILATPRASRPRSGDGPRSRAPVRAHGVPPGPQPTAGTGHHLHPDRTRKSKVSH